MSSRAQCPGAAPGRGRRNRKSKTQPGDSWPQSRWQRAGLAAHPADLPCPQPRSDPSPRLFPQRTKKFHLDFGFGTLFQAPPASPILLGQGSGLSKRPAAHRDYFIARSSTYRIGLTHQSSAVNPWRSPHGAWLGQSCGCHAPGLPWGHPDQGQSPGRCCQLYPFGAPGSNPNRAPAGSAAPLVCSSQPAADSSTG